MAEAEKGVDLDTLLRQEAIREIIVNGDDTLSYSAVRSNQGSNWLAFEPRVGLRQFMPWDVDLTFGQQYTVCQPTPLKCAPTTPLLRHCATTTSIIGKLTVCHGEIQKRYLQIMCQLTNGTLGALGALEGEPVAAAGDHQVAQTHQVAAQRACPGTPAGGRPSIAPTRGRGRLRGGRFRLAPAEVEPERGYFRAGQRCSQCECRAHCWDPYTPTREETPQRQRKNFRS